MGTRVLLLKWALKRRAEKAVIWVAWRLPSRIVYWSAIRVMTSQNRREVFPGNPADRTCGDALKSWG